MRMMPRAVVATGLAVTIGLAGPAGLAQASPPRATVQTQAAAAGFDWTSLVIAVASHLLGGGGGGSDLDAAVQQIVAAVQQAETDIIAHADAIAAADVQACVRAANIESFPPPVLILWAQNATSCAELATAYATAST